MNQQNFMTVSWSNNSAMPPLPPYNVLKGGDNMDDKYVTRPEFNDAMNRIDKRFDDLDRKLDKNTDDIKLKFEQQKVWFFGTAISIVGAISAMIAIIGTLIKLI